MNIIVTRLMNRLKKKKKINRRMLEYNVVDFVR